MSVFLLASKNYSVAHCSAVDDVVLGYVAEVLSDVGQEGDSSFDIDLFVEMMAAYVPEFADVDR